MTRQALIGQLKISCYMDITKYSHHIVPSYQYLPVNYSDLVR